MMGKIKKLGLGAVVLGSVALGIIYFSFPEAKWRVDVVLLKLSGQIEGIELGDIVRMISPGSRVWLQPLSETRNPYSSIHNPYDAPEHVSDGEKIFEHDCVICHGSKGIGNSGPPLARRHFSNGDSDWSVFKVVRDGIDGSAMPSNELKERELWSLVAYIRSIQRNQSEWVPEKILELPSVTAEMLLDSSDTPENWLTYSGSYYGQRYSKLNQVTNQNASKVSIRWIYQFSGTEGTQVTSPIVNSGMMYLTESPNTVHALDAATGKLVWSYTYQNQDDIVVCCGPVNRGVALYQNTILMGTADSHLIALDALNGTLNWDVELHDYRLGSSITAAPLVVDEKVLVGYGGGDFGLRGFLDAVNVSDGSKAWRFYTVPGVGEPGNESWSGDSWKTGGAPTWLTGSYDNKTGLLFWTVGNPAPDHQGDLRLGDNLYSDSVVAIDMDSGKLAWHFQFTPHDEHDWDSNQIPVLVDREWHGKQRRLLLLANRNGFFYVLDRDTGEFLLAKAFVKQNWAKSIDAKGRPILNPDTILTSEGKVTWPSPIGATNWQSPTYSPKTGLFYVSALEWGQIMFKDVEVAEYRAGELFLGGYHKGIPGDEKFFFAIRALDPETGNLVWEYKNPPRGKWWKTGGLISTAGNVVFGGDGSDLFFLDAETGTELWRKNAGGRINASPITYKVDNTQFFAIAAGRSIIALAIDQPN